MGDQSKPSTLQDSPGGLLFSFSKKCNISSEILTILSNTIPLSLPKILTNFLFRPPLAHLVKKLRIVVPFSYPFQPNFCLQCTSSLNNSCSNSLFPKALCVESSREKFPSYSTTSMLTISLGCSFFFSLSF